MTSKQTDPDLPMSLVSLDIPTHPFRLLSCLLIVPALRLLLTVHRYWDGKSDSRSQCLVTCTDRRREAQRESSTGLPRMVLYHVSISACRPKRYTHRRRCLTVCWALESNKEFLPVPPRSISSGIRSDRMHGAGRIGIAAYAWEIRTLTLDRTGVSIARGNCS
jgi:hypothetical protein